MRIFLLLFALVGVAVGVILTRSQPSAPRDRYDVAEERIAVERARGHIDAAQAEELRLALRFAHDDTQSPRYKVLRGTALKSATSEVSACRITDLTPWLDESVGVADCSFTPLAR